MKPNIHDILAIKTKAEFSDMALKVFYYQAKENLVYQSFIQHLGINPTDVKHLKDIPFLPIGFFKHHQIICGKNPIIQKTFLSSGTTASQQSKHLVSDLQCYYQSLHHSFVDFYGRFNDYEIFALLPSYLEREDSSLIEMVKFWFEQAKQQPKYYLYNHQDLYHDLMLANQQQKPVLLIGVAFALLDFANAHPCQLPNTVVIETGGMKGRKKEIIRSDLHQTLQNLLNPKRIDSEYGMTELLSQAYAQGTDRFKTPNWMKVLVRDTDDPFALLPHRKTGGLNMIDLANLNACAFIATDDLGLTHPSNEFEVLGRFDHSDIRGCSLLLNE